MNLKPGLPRRPQDARVLGYLPRRAVTREWNQPRREKRVAVNRAEKSWISEECFDIRHGDVEFKVCPAGQAVVAHAFYPSTREAEAGGSL